VPVSLAAFRARPEPWVWAVACVGLIGAFQTPAAAVAWPLGRATAAAATLALAAWLAGFHRPFGSSGVGAIAAPLTLAGLGLGFGPLVLSIAAGGALAATDVLRDEGADARATFGAAARALLGALGAGAVAALAGHPGWGLLGWVGSIALIDLLTPLNGGRRMAVILLETCAWGIGMLLAGVSPAPGAAATVVDVAPAAWVLTFAFGLAWAEAGRQAIAREFSNRSRAALDSRARTDAASGLPRTEETMQWLDTARFEAMRDGSALAVALYDLRGLATTNADRGTAGGDARLADLAQRLDGRGRGGRCHGDLLWILPGCDGQEGLQIADAVRRAADQSGNSAWCGLVSTPAVAARSADDLVALARAAVVVAKQSGESSTVIDCGGGVYEDGEGRVRATVERPRSTTPSFFA
jgi:GGDEF domain-containing protein